MEEKQDVSVANMASQEPVPAQSGDASVAAATLVDAANTNTDIDSLIGEHYVPSALERKKSLMMYVIRGILLSLSQEKASRYELFHLKQALGRRTMFFLLLIPALVLSFIPYIKVLPLLAYIALLAVWIMFFMQAWKGAFTSIAPDRPFLPVFAGFGGWVLSIFDSKLDVDSSLH